MGALRDYFSFSKRERTGAIVLIILIVFIFLLPEFYPAPKICVDQNEIAEFKSQVSKLKTITNDSTQEEEISSGPNYEQSSPGIPKAKLFYFDPNKISTDGWRKLGVRDRTIGTIQNYISKGGYFKRAEDLGRIYGLPKEKYEQLLPFVRIVGKNQENKQEERKEKFPEYNRQADRVAVTVDLNETDTSLLIALPGIGSKLATRILNFREKLGGFYSVEQVKEVFGLPDSTFQKIKPFLRCDSSQIHKLNINTADESMLKDHPYIKWNLARAIVNYRHQHGVYDRLDKLMEIDIISADIFQKISPYLKVE
jgi:competence ComEA-like helix-hairpin-helix protein